MSKTSKNLKSRILVGLVLGFTVLVGNYFGDFIWTGMLLLTSLLAVREFNRLLRARGFHPSSFWIRILVAGFILFPTRMDPDHIYFVQGFLVAISFTILLLRMFLNPKKQITSFEDISASLWSIIYLGFLPSFFAWIRGLEHGPEFIIILISTVAMSDISAMLYGKASGKIPLSPQISPNKTLEGSLCGLAMATLMFYGSVKFFGLGLNHANLYNLLPTVKFDWIILGLMGFLIAFISQVGDLLESLLKREAGVKDSGKLLDAHGGILDRVDSHFFAAWIGYFIFRYLIA